MTRRVEPRNQLDCAFHASAGDEPDRAPYPLIVAFCRVAGPQSSPTRRDAPRREISIMKTDAVQYEPVMNRTQTPKDRRPPPGHSRHGPPGTDMSQVGKVAGRALHPTSEAVTAEHQRIGDGTAHG